MYRQRPFKCGILSLTGEKQILQQYITRRTRLVSNTLRNLLFTVIIWGEKYIWWLDGKSLDLGGWGEIKKKQVHPPIFVERVNFQIKIYSHLLNCKADWLGNYFNWFLGAENWRKYSVNDCTSYILNAHIKLHVNIKRLD